MHLFTETHDVTITVDPVYTIDSADIFDIAFDMVDKKIGVQKIEVIGIRMDRPINHLENKDR